MIVLTVRVPGEPPRRVRLDRPSLSLGRASTNDLPLGDRTLSRSHARIEESSLGPVLVDLGSRNGTALNGQRIEGRAILRPGDRVRLGETVIEVADESPASARVLIDAGADSSESMENTVFRSSQDLVRSHREERNAEMGRDELARLNASLRILNDVSRELLNDVPISQLLTLILDKVFAYLAPDRGLLMLSDESGKLKPEAVKFADGVDPSDIRLSQTLVQSVMERRNGVLMIDTVSDVKLSAADSIRLQGITSCIAAPLFVEEKVLGLIYLEVRLGRKSFSEDDLRLLTSLANTAAIKMQNLKLQEQAVDRHRMEREMALAWDIQRRLLPDREPEIPGTHVQGRTIPSRTVSGDYFDYYLRADRCLDVVVADVCGKGMGASILAASVQAAFQAWASENFPPDKLCARLSDLIYRRTSPEKFVTMILALYDPETGAVMYTNAGHNPGLLIRIDGRVELLPAHGPPLGIFAGSRYSAGSLTMGAGDLLMLYTDGLTEASTAEDEEFGLERLSRLVVSLRTRPLVEIEARVGEALASFVGGVPDGDDRTLVLLRRE